MKVNQFDFYTKEDDHTFPSFVIDVII